MSIDLITMVRRRLDVSHGELLVAVELADAANDDGEGIFVGVNRLADRSRQDPRTVQRQLKRLIEVKWLEVVKMGGGRRADGTGIPTTYRINHAWVKGDTLPGLPDFVPKFYQQDKGDKLSPLPEPNGDKQGGSTVTKTPNKGDTAVSPDPLTHIPKDARARATPSGSRPPRDGKPEPPVYDEIERSRFWGSTAMRVVIDEAVMFGIVTHGARWSALPGNIQVEMAARVDHWVNWALEREMSTALDHRSIDDRVRHELRIEMKQFKPPTFAERFTPAAA